MGLDYSGFCISCREVAHALRHLRLLLMLLVAICTACPGSARSLANEDYDPLLKRSTAGMHLLWLVLPSCCLQLLSRTHTVRHLYICTGFL